MMWITQWKHHVTLVFGYLCVTVLSMRGIRSDTYGDLGDEIIIGYPTHQTTRKNQIPTVRDVPQDSLQKRTIVHNSPLDHYKNPLYYREFISEPHPRVPYETRIPSLRRNVKHFSKINRYRKDFIHRPRFSGQYMPSYIMQPPISPQEAIRMRALYPRTLRPDPARTLGRGPLSGGTLGRTLQRPAAQPVAPARRLYRVAARPKILARPPASANAKYYLSRRLINERGKVQHHLHVQVVPKGPLDPSKATKLGLHSGFVLLPAKRVPAKRVLPQRPREPVRAVGKPPGVDPRLRQAIKSPLQPQPHPVQSSRFSERKHIWIPSSHLNAQEIPVQEMTSYHVDEIGNLIPDKDPSKSEQYPAQALKANSQLMKNLGKVTMKWAGYSPILRKNIQKNPTWLEALEGALTPKYPEAKSQASHNRELSSSIYQIVKQVKQSPGAKVAAKKPSLATRTKPKSSRRILYFAQHANPLPKQTLNPRYRPLAQRPRTATPVARYSRPKPNIQRQTTKVSHFIEQLQRSLASPRASKEYEIPKVSNKVYRYINEKTVSAPGNTRAINTNPLLSYLQYHRTHPSTNERIPSRLPVRQIIHAAPRRLNADNRCRLARQMHVRC